MPDRRSRRHAWLTLWIGALLLVLTSPGTVAHDIPNEIVLTGFVKPQGERLHLLVRVPLVMLTNINLPKRGPGYLELQEVDETIDKAVHAITREIAPYENGTELQVLKAKTRISQPSERTFDSYENARAHIEGPPLPSDANVFWNQGYFDVHLEYPIRSEQSRFALDFGIAPGLSGRLKLALRFMSPDGATVAYVVHGGFGRFVLNPSWLNAGWLFVKLGFFHIMDGIDHLLFLLCLVIPFGRREVWSLVGVVTAFTVAHSITLIASALEAVPAGDWFPPVVEALIAASIVYMALENIVAAMRGIEAGGILRRRWVVTAAFGLAHGFGFSFALKEDLQFAGSHLLLSLLSFNVGVELGQLVALVIVLFASALLLRTDISRRLGVGVVSVLAGHTSWHWMSERIDALSYVEWPDWRESSPVMWFLVAAIFLAAFWILFWLGGKRRGGGTDKEPRQS